MAIDTSIWNNALRPARSVADYDAENQDFQKNQLNLQTQRQGITDANALRAATAGFGNDQAANYNSLLKTGNISAATSYQKALMDQQKGQSEVNKNASEVPLNNSRALEQQSLASMHALDSSIKNHDFHIQQLGALTDPSQVPAWIDQGVKSGVFTPDQAQQGFQRFQQAVQQPGGFDAWKQQALQGGVSATDQLKQQQQLLIANQAQTGENSRNAASNATHVQTAGMAQAGENSRAALSRQAQLTVAGLGPDGVPTGDTTAMVDAIGQYKIQPPNGMALRNPRMQSILAQVAQKYPDFDATTYGERQKAAKDFGSGPQGQQIQSGNTALNHIATLKELAQAQANGNTPLFNQLANRFAAETGQAAPTNLKAAITMVGPEISKAVIGAGGGVSDREKVDSALSAVVKGSPAQAAGTFGTLEDLFGGRLQEQARTYSRTTGRKDFSDAFLSPAAQAALTKRGGAPGAPAAMAHPPEITDLLNKYGAK